MEYIYFKSKYGNIGDDLNGWMWPKVFGKENVNDNIIFLGIGTILNKDVLFIDNVIKSSNKKIVFGSGVRYGYEPFLLDNSWDIRFLRGALSARFFNNQFKYITDSAYSIRQLPDFRNFENFKKKYKVSLMPHISSMKYFNWDKICEELGYNFISPYCNNTVDETLTEIASSEYIITEAMHGAILADIFRIPWSRFILSTPLSEGTAISEFKWYDWLSSIDINFIKSNYIKLYRKPSINRHLLMVTRDRINIEFLLKQHTTDSIIESLQFDKNEFYLSDGILLNTIDNKLNESINSLKRELVDNRFNIL